MDIDKRATVLGPADAGGNVEVQAGIIRTRHTVPAALAADLTGFLASAFAVRLFFGA